MSICQRERWLAMIARSDDEVVLAPLGEAAQTDAQVELISDAVLHAFADGAPAAIAGVNVPSAALEHGADRDIGKDRSRHRDGAGPAWPFARSGGVLSAATRMDESAMAVVAVIDHGIKPTVHPDVTDGRRHRTRPHHDQLHDRS